MFYISITIYIEKLIPFSVSSLEKFGILFNVLLWISKTK